MITKTPVNAAEAVTAYRSSRGNNAKILVGLRGTLECIRWGKIVHIENVRRLPKIHKDGTVTVRWNREDCEIEAHRVDFVGDDGREFSWFSFDLV